MLSVCVCPWVPLKQHSVMILVRLTFLDWHRVWQCFLRSASSNTACWSQSQRWVEGWRRGALERHLLLFVSNFFLSTPHTLLLPRDVCLFFLIEWSWSRERASERESNASSLTHTHTHIVTSLSITLEVFYCAPEPRRFFTITSERERRFTLCRLTG